MSSHGRLVNIQGGPYEASQIASAAALIVNDSWMYFQVSGNTTVTSLNNPGNRVIANRVVILEGANAAATAVVLTNTNLSSSPTSGQMVLAGGANVMLQRGQNIWLMQHSDGVWYEI